MRNNSKLAIMMNNKCDPKTAVKIRKRLPFRSLIRFSKKWQLFRAILESAVILIDFLFQGVSNYIKKVVLSFLLQ